LTGITSEQLGAAHRADLDLESEEHVHSQHAWADPASGAVFCLSDGPSREPLLRVHERAGHPAEEIDDARSRSRSVRPWSRRPRQ